MVAFAAGFVVAFVVRFVVRFVGVGVGGRPFGHQLRGPARRIRLGTRTALITVAST
ncbi:MAG: hypothetical protein HOW71_28495, partial [Nonomuraea sp.]|nr:hypothetical protein [Nonomuraea sp.]